MAILNPRQPPNIWAQAPQRNPIVDAMISRREREQEAEMFNTRMMMQLAQELNPAKYIDKASTKWQLEEMEKLQIELSKIASRSGTEVMEANDMLEVKFMLDDFEEQQNEVLMRTDSFKKEYDFAMRKENITKIDPEKFAAAVKIGVTDISMYTPGDLLQWIPKDWTEWAKTMQANPGKDKPYREEPTGKTRTNAGNGKKEYQVIQYWDDENRSRSKREFNAEYMRTQGNGGADEGIQLYWDAMGEDVSTMETAFQNQPTMDSEGNRLEPIQNRNAWFGNNFVAPLMYKPTEKWVEDKDYNDIQQFKEKEDIKTEEQIKDENRKMIIDDDKKQKEAVSKANTEYENTRHEIKWTTLTENTTGTTGMYNKSREMSDEGPYMSMDFTAQVEVMKLIRGKNAKTPSIAVPENWILLNTSNDNYTDFIGQSTQDAKLSGFTSTVDAGYQYSGHNQLKVGGDPLDLSLVITDKAVRKELFGGKSDTDAAYTIYPGMPIPDDVMDHLYDVLPNENGTPEEQKGVLKPMVADRIEVGLGLGQSLSLKIPNIGQVSLWVPPTDESKALLESLSTKKPASAIPLEDFKGKQFTIGGVSGVFNFEILLTQYGEDGFRELLDNGWISISE